MFVLFNVKIVGSYSLPAARKARKVTMVPTVKNVVIFGGQPNRSFCEELRMFLEFPVLPGDFLISGHSIFQCIKVVLEFELIPFR